MSGFSPTVLKMRKYVEHNITGLLNELGDRPGFSVSRRTPFLNEAIALLKSGNISPWNEHNCKLVTNAVREIADAKHHARLAPAPEAKTTKTDSLGADAAKCVKAMHRYVGKNFNAIMLEIATRTRTGSFKDSKHYFSAVAMLAHSGISGRISLVEAAINEHMQKVCIGIARAEKAEAARREQIKHAVKKPTKSTPAKKMLAMINGGNLEKKTRTRNKPTK